MDHFLEKYGTKIIGHLSGFDRLVFRGTLRQLAVKDLFEKFLSYSNVLLKDFANYVEAKSQQLKTDWVSVLDGVARRLNPDHQEMLAPYPPSYFWSAYQTEWATDIMFSPTADLAALYRHLTLAGICLFSSHDVMRFFGHAPHWNFQGEVVTSYKHRPEGVRIKHWYKANSVKLYDKYPTLFRCEATVNDPGDFKVLRPKDGDSHGPESWRELRRGVSDLYRRAQVSQSIVNRCLNAYATIDVSDEAAAVLAPVCQPTRRKSRRVRGLRPFANDDIALVRAVNDGRFTVNGFRNGDIRTMLYGPTVVEERHRLSSKVSRQLAILRAHGLIRRLPSSHRYVLTAKGRLVANAILALHSPNLNPKQPEAATA